MSKELSINHVCICAATYLRPKGLSRLLDSLNKLNVSDLPSNILVSVVIVDNDPNQSSATIINEYKTKGFRFSLDYFVESTRGIPQARNRLLLAAKDLKADVIAMIDDDETVDENWLSTGLNSMDQWEADVIFGHLVPVFETTPPKWIIDGSYFEFPFYKDGTDLNVAYTYNVFFKTKILEVVPGFDNSLPLTGGTDVIFFRQVYKAGFSIKFCSLCVVYDYIPKQRMSLKWILSRGLRCGFPFELILNKKTNKSNFLPRIKLIMASLLLNFFSVFFAPLIILRLIPLKVIDILGKFFGAKAYLFLRKTNNGYRGCLWFFVLTLGYIAGVFGYRYKEYTKPTVENIN